MDVKEHVVNQLKMIQLEDCIKKKRMQNKSSRTLYNKDFMKIIVNRNCREPSI